MKNRRIANDVSLSSGDCHVEDGMLLWSILAVDADEPAGNMEFTCDASGSNSLFPIHIKFRSESSICGMEVSGEFVMTASQVRLTDGYDFRFSRSPTLTTTFRCKLRSMSSVPPGPTAWGRIFHDYNGFVRSVSHTLIYS